jgi:hypothetical protein
MSEAAPTLAWSIPNMITVTLMVLIVFAALGFVWRAFRGATMQAPSDGNPSNAAAAQAGS